MKLTHTPLVSNQPDWGMTLRTKQQRNLPLFLSLRKSKDFSSISISISVCLHIYIYIFILDGFEIKSSNCNLPLFLSLRKSKDFSFAYICICILVWLHIYIHSYFHFGWFWEKKQQLQLAPLLLSEKIKILVLFVFVFIFLFVFIFTFIFLFWMVLREKKNPFLFSEKMRGLRRSLCWQTRPFWLQLRTLQSGAKQGRKSKDPGLQFHKKKFWPKETPQSGIWLKTFLLVHTMHSSVQHYLGVALLDPPSGALSP